MRLTNRKTYSDLKNNAERLQAKGMEVSISDLMYIKLAEYENAEEDAHEACKEMQACVDNWDEEEAHIAADDILCTALEKFGCRDLTELFEKVDKWYS